MKYLTTVRTDVGIRKKTNQDALLIRVADTDYGRVLLGVVCDGMGGLAKGEVASSTLIRAFSSWFEDELPKLLLGGLTEASLRESWNQLASHTNKKIAAYGERNRLSLGTTLVALLLIEGTYYIINIGDSRAYYIKDELICLTKDQTYVQREVDLGNMTPEEALVSPQRNILLQCVGASEIIQPDFYSGSYDKDTVFMLCTDGFRHVITEHEFFERLSPYLLFTEETMSDAALYFTELNKYRQETDNISVALIKVC